MTLADHDYAKALEVWDDAAALLTYLGPRVSQDEYPRVEAMYDRLVSNRGILVRAAAEKGLMLLVEGKGNLAG